MKKAIVAVSAWIVLALVVPAAEVVEIGPGREAELPGGKEADGIRGDFVLRSNTVEAVVSGNLPNRRANMSTFYGEDGISPGCLYDLTLKGANNDQLVCYGPCGHGPVSYVRIVPDDADGIVESVTTAALNRGIFKRHEYRVKDGESGVWITTELRNESNEVKTASTKDDLTRFNETGTVSGGVRWMDAINPDHRCGYAVGTVSVEGAEKMANDIELQPRQSVVIKRFFAIGNSPASAVGEYLVRSDAKIRVVEGSIKGADGEPVSTATFLVPYGKTSVPGYSDDQGHFGFHLLAADDTESIEVKDRGRTGLKFPIPTDVSTALALKLDGAAGVRFQIRDGDDLDMPCKVLFEGINGTAAPDLGPKERAHGCVDQYHSETGKFFVALTPGDYRVTVLRGPEYSHLQREIKVPSETIVDYQGKLTRLVDTTGWISADFHNHSTPSGDNVCDTDGRLISLAAEHIEFAPTTEHNRLYDWKPMIVELGLRPFLNTVKGVELTGRGQHFNSFPFEPKPYEQDGGAPVWSDDPRLTALTLRRWQGENPTRWIQFNHPSLSDLFVDRNGDGLADGGYMGLGTMVDGTESQNFSDSQILSEAPFVVNRTAGALAAKVTMVREFLWKQLLNKGHRLVAVAVADAHAVHGNGVGGWRIYLPSQTDAPDQIQWQDLSPHAKGGHVMLTTGPFLEVTTAEGAIAGDDTRAAGEVTLHVKVQCTDWQDIDRVQVLVNGRADPKMVYTRETHPDLFEDGVIKFDQNIYVKLQEDAHLIVVADHRSMTLEKGFGTSSQASLRPTAYINPIYVDIDGGGFQANGDTLGFPIPSARITADEARDQLIRAGLMTAPAPVQPLPQSIPGPAEKP